MASILEQTAADTIARGASRPRAPTWARELATPGPIPALDALRAAAIILVLCRHGVRTFWDANGHALLPTGGWDLAIPLINGWVGVDLFFALSGFLIGRQLLGMRARGERGLADFGRYLLRRALRILPAYYAVLAIAALGVVPYFAVAPEHLGLRVAWHALMLQDYLPPNIVIAFWSLGVEEKFYLAAPLLLGFALLLGNRAAQYVALVAVAASSLLFRYLTHLAHPEPMAFYPFFLAFRTPFHQCLEPLVLGLLGALIQRDWPALMARRWVARLGAGDVGAGRVRIAKAAFWAGLAGAAILLLWRPMLDHLDAADRLYQPTLIAFAMAACVVGAALGGAPSGLARPWLVVTAKLAYGLYLSHLLILPGTIRLIETMFDATAWSPLARFLAFLPPYLVLSFAFALALHLAVERPFLKLKERIGRPDARSVRAFGA